MLQEIIVLVLVAGAALFLAWRWMPAPWRARLRGAPAADQAKAGCSACSSCGGCGSSSAGPAPRSPQ